MVNTIRRLLFRSKISPLVIKVTTTAGTLVSAACKVSTGVRDCGTRMASVCSGVTGDKAT